MNRQPKCPRCKRRTSHRTAKQVETCLAMPPKYEVTWPILDLSKWPFK